jgi:hypothetical protein
MNDSRQSLDRRTFVKGVAAVSTFAAGAATTSASTVEQTALENDQQTAPAARPIRHILLFMHPPVTYSYHKLLRPAPQIAKRWHALLAERAEEETTAVCIVQSSRGDKPLVEIAQQLFGDRCIIDPSDKSDKTMVLAAGDMNRAFGKRGNHGEWNIYELWSSNNARYWVEGLKQQFAQRGFTYDPATLTMETFGSWSGCHHKYSNFMAAYLGMTKPATIHGEPELCTLKDFPMDVGEFVESVVLDRHVLMTLFRRTDGLPMAQFWDGLRPVYEPPHTATIDIPPGDVELFLFSPNSLIPAVGDSRKLPRGVVADVGDGCRPAFTTVVGRHHGDAKFQAFRDAMIHADITPIDPPRQVSYSVEV